MQNVVAYVHSANPLCCRIQERIIQEYCNRHKIHLEKMFVDNGVQESYVKTGDDVQKLVQRKRGFAARKKLLMEIRRGTVRCVLVDSSIRLRVNPSETKGLLEWCSKQDVIIVEVSMDNAPGDAQHRNVAVYHFTDDSMKRPSIVEKEVDNLYEYASSHHGWKLNALYLDYTLVKTKQFRYQDLKAETGRFDVILVKDFYHIQTKTSTFWNHVIEFLNQGIAVHSILDGNLDRFYDKSMLEEELDAAVYFCGTEKTKEYSLRIVAIKTYAELKTNWEVTGVYADAIKKYGDEQPELDRLVAEAEKYDLILVDSFGSIHFRTSRFMKIKKQLGKPIFSVKEGGILF